MIYHFSYFKNSVNIRQDTSALTSNVDSLKLSLNANFSDSSFLINKKEANIIQKIKQGYDATSYYYQQSDSFAPIAGYFLNPDYFPQHYTEISGQSLKAENSLNLSNEFKLKQSDALLLILLGLAALIAYVRFSTYGLIKRISISVFSFAYSRTLYNEHTKLLFFKNIILQTVFYISSGILLVHLGLHFHFFNETAVSLSTYLLAILIILTLIVFYKVLVWLLGILSDSKEIVLEYLYYINNSLKFLGLFNVIVLFVLLFGVSYFQIYLVYIIFLIYLIVYVIRVYKIFYEFFRNRFSLFYLILYFCALEIVPIMMLIKHITILSATEFVYF